MRIRLLTLTAVMLSTLVPASAQNAKATKSTYSPPRMPDGHPDLQGVYDIATITPVERRAGGSLVLTKEQAAKLENAAAGRVEKEDAPLDPNRKAPPKGGDGSPGPYGNVGGYNYGWLDHRFQDQRRERRIPVVNRGRSAGWARSCHDAGGAGADDVAAGAAEVG